MLSFPEKTASVFLNFSHALVFDTGDLINCYNFRNLQNKDLLLKYSCVLEIGVRLSQLNLFTDTVLA